MMSTVVFMATGACAFAATRDNDFTLVALDILR